MIKKEIDPKYINEVLYVVSDEVQLRAASREQLLAYHAQIGYWLAIANANHEKTKEDRHYAESDSMLAAKLADPKMTQALLEANAVKAAQPYRDAEIRAKQQAEKLANLYDTLGKALA